MNARRRSACYPRSTFYLLSDGPSTRNHRVTRPCFHICLTYQSRSRAPLCPYTLRTIANRAEGAFGLLRYLLGGDRPSQTTHLALSLARIHGSRLGDSWHKGGISTVAQPRPEPGLQRLPPILRMRHKAPIPSYSKGSRGLSVLLRERGIFTASVISPSPLLRQCSTRYAIHARRNLPDKELRYHRTVIVTAAVYRGLGCQLLRDYSPMTAFLDLPAPGRRQTLYILLRVGRVLCF
jgi:hypothetical protein